MLGRPINLNHKYIMEGTGMVTYEEIAKMIDHSLLKPEMTDKEIEDGCKLADRYKVAAVSVRPGDVKLAKKVLKDSEVLIDTIIGFPHGTTTTLTKVTEAKEAIENGAAELDVVLNIGKLKSKDFEYVKQDLQAVAEIAKKNRVIIKVIFENCYLSEDEIIAACKICNEIGVDFIKTSTGFGSGGALDKDLKLMRKYAKPGIQLKAAGGVRSLERAIEVKMLGCTRFGCTVTAGILERLK
jgi:deoxyribose-phosphate aldolase